MRSDICIYFSPEIVIIIKIEIILNKGVSLEILFYNTCTTML